MAKRSLQALQEKIQSDSRENTSNNGFYYPHWKLPKDGITNIRIIEDPDQENPLVVYMEFFEHVLHFGDEITRTPCPKNKGKENPCPICEMSSKFYKTKDEKRGKYFYRDMYAILRGIVTKDGLEYAESETPATGTVKAFKFSYQLSTKLKAEIGKLDKDDVFWDLDEGLDFSIVKQIQQVGDKEYGKYDLSSGFVRRSTSISKEWAASVDDAPLSALMPEIPSYDEVDEILQRYLKNEFNKTSDSSEEEGMTDEELMASIKNRRNKVKVDDEETPAAKKTVAEKPAKKESSARVRDDDVDVLAELAESDSEEEDDADILAQLRDD